MPQFVWFFVMTLTLSGAAHADDDDCKVNGGGSPALHQCMETRCKAVKACKAASDKAVGTSNQAAGAVGDKYNSTKQITTSAGDSTKVQAGTSQLLGGALTECDTAKKTCDDKCKPDKVEQKEKAKVKDELKKCGDEIEAIKTPLAKGKTDADAAAKGSDDTKKESGGQMPMMQMPQSDSKKDDDSKDSTSPATTPTPTPTPTPSPAATDTASTGSTAAAVTPAAAISPATSCSDESSLKSACLDDYQSKCLNSTSSLCTQFNNRYCGGNGVTGGMEGADDIKAGSGAGAEYCATKTAQTYCAVGGRDSCDSCRKLKGLSPLPTDQQASACGISPASLPTLQKSGSSSALGTASMGGSSGSSGGGGASTVAAPSPGTNAVKENPYDKLNGAMNMSADGGGGGGGGANGGGGEASPDTTLADLASGYGIIGRTPSSGSGDATLQAASVNATDIGVGGPHVFQLVDDVYRARCAAKKYDNCPPRP